MNMNRLKLISSVVQSKNPSFKLFEFAEIRNALSLTNVQKQPNLTTLATTHLTKTNSFRFNHLVECAISRYIEGS